MTLAVTHAFQSAKGDGPDTSLIQPSNWNASHTMTCATDKLLGRTTAGTGPVEEITISDYFQTLLASANAAALVTLLGIGAFTTGDVKLTLKNIADAGWVLMDDGTIGNAGSGASTRSNADTATLYALIWTNFSNSLAPVTGGRGANAPADFAAGKPIKLLRVLGRALAASGNGAGLSNRTLGAFTGEEGHTLIVAEMPSHNHGGDTENATHSHTYVDSGSGSDTVQSGGGASVADNNGPTKTTDSNTHKHDIPNQGGNDPHNNMQPTVFLNVMVKL